jgi:hypothetical protein
VGIHFGTEGEERRETVENGDEIHCRREIGENEEERKGDTGE